MRVYGRRRGGARDSDASSGAPRCARSWISRGLLTGLAILLAGCATQPDAVPVTVSILGTNDVHGQLLPADGRGGLVTVSGYVEALRDARGDDFVLLIDAGDMWQGTLESNLTEGATVVEAYNAMGYVAAAIGNHEFDFGPAGPKATPQSAADDARGALKARAAEARFPLLAANLVDTATGELVDWPNVQPSIVVDAGGVDVGIVGVMTRKALATTIAANVGDLAVLPLTDAIVREATALRARGADLVVVTAHAGGRCTAFDDPLDLSSCDLSAEIMRVAAELPPGLVDHIIGGHVHGGVAHVVNGVSITSSHSRTHAFSRADFTVDSVTGDVLARRVFPPQPACPYRDASGDCQWQAAARDRPANAYYEGHVVTPDPDVVAIAMRAAGDADRVKNAPLGTHLETPFTLKGNPESALGNLMTDALLASIGADVAIHNVSGGIRAALPQGQLTYGAVYEMFPFDNRVVVLELSGRELKRVIAGQARKGRRRAGFSGMRVSVRCDGPMMRVDMTLPDGRQIADADVVRVVANDFLAYGGDEILTPVIPPQGFAVADDMPLTRDVLLAWLTNRGTLRADDFLTGDRPKWRVPPKLPADCGLAGSDDFADTLAP